MLDDFFVVTAVKAAAFSAVTADFSAVMHNSGKARQLLGNARGFRSRNPT
jgi:hypothetical protein